MTAQVRAFLTSHYSTPGNNDTAITTTLRSGASQLEKRRDAPTSSPTSTGNNLDINNTSVCNGIGRPL